MPLSKRPLSQALQEAAATSAKQRSNECVKALQDAMKTIDEEMAENDNIYPNNDGKLNQRELCRRAGVSYMTLQAPSHKGTTRVQVQTWLQSKTIVTKTDAAKATTDRASHWKEQHRLVATQICIYELALKEKDLQIGKLRQEKDDTIKDLRQQVEHLKSQLFNAGARILNMADLTGQTSTT